MKHRFSFHAESVCVCWCSSFWVSAVFGCLLNFGWHWQDAKTRLLHTHTHSHSIGMQFSTHSREYCAFIRLFVDDVRVSLGCALPSSHRKTRTAIRERLFGVSDANGLGRWTRKIESTCEEKKIQFIVLPGVEPDR